MSLFRVRVSSVESYDIFSHKCATKRISKTSGNIFPYFHSFKKIIYYIVNFLMMCGSKINACLCKQI